MKFLRETRINDRGDRSAAYGLLVEWLVRRLEDPEWDGGHDALLLVHNLLLQQSNKADRDCKIGACLD